MDIVDSQVHFGPDGIDELLAGMDALGINAVLADEFWGLDNWGPGYRLPNGVLRVTAPTAELAATRHPDRFSYVLRVERRDPEVHSLDPYGRRRAGHSGDTHVAEPHRPTNWMLLRTVPTQTCSIPRAASVCRCFFTSPGHVELLPRYLEEFTTRAVLLSTTAVCRWSRASVFSRLKRLNKPLE